MSIQLFTWIAFVTSYDLSYGNISLTLRFCRDQISSLFLLLECFALVWWVWCLCRNIWDPDAPQVYFTFCPPTISTGICLAGCRFVSDSSPWQRIDKHIWQKLLCRLATELLYWILEWNAYFCCILQSNKFVTANPLSCFVSFTSQEAHKHRPFFDSNFIVTFDIDTI